MTRSRRAAASQLQAQPAKAEQLERQLLAALPDLRETASLLRKAAGQLQSHLLAQRLLKERAQGAQLPGSCQLLGVNAELAELCCTTLLNLLDDESSHGAALRTAAQKQSNGSGTGTASGSGGQASAPPMQPGSSNAVGLEEPHPTGQGSPKRQRCDSPPAAPGPLS
ncbi:4-amino-4-deoxy-L-arabinose transferase [Chlorella sorokiniana]|uniref:4-amino-4-deoxy-L-arabinose transferase n=1 Tax=Chlorella sorokiniana TaxID=3076 RepID=A0A2P6U3M1_CHLSO|nr:4-amino-4-deoxy-L-arabinose transferase [Chlorella sorokiniana]|eukprot:PRW60912.1 4-amino-4-deoxy-L-arabinose transferase [Chlorella sorokiniana]